MTSQSQRLSAPVSLPWTAWFRHAIATLRMTPGAFWALSVDEWRWLIAPETDAALSRVDLASLLKQYPDGHHG